MPSPTISTTGEESAKESMPMDADKSAILRNDTSESGAIGNTANGSTPMQTTNGSTTKPVVPTANPPTKATSAVGAAAPAAFAPPTNARIEVLWRLESDAAVEERWWGARVQDIERVNGRARHILLYDSYGEFGEEVARVEFRPDGETLIDLSRADDADGGLLGWRMEGAANAVSEVLTVQDVADAVRDGGEGDTVFGAMLEALTSLPADRQLRYASGYRMFADRIKDALMQLVREKGDDYVVTAADVHAIFAQLKLDAAAGRL